MRSYLKGQEGPSAWWFRLLSSSLSLSVVLSVVAIVLYLVAEVVIGRSDARVLEGRGSPWWRNLGLATALAGVVLAGLGIRAGVNAVRLCSGWRRLAAPVSIAIAGWALLLNGFMVFVDEIVFA